MALQSGARLAAPESPEGAMLASIPGPLPHPPVGEAPESILLTNGFPIVSGCEDDDFPQLTHLLTS